MTRQELLLPTTLNAPLLSTGFETPKWSSRFYGPTMATLLYRVFQQ